jgi:phytoene synthase
MLLKILILEGLTLDLNFEEIRSTIKLSESYYENSFYSIKEIPLAFRFAILVARRVYRKNWL